MIIKKCLIIIVLVACIHHLHAQKDSAVIWSYELEGQAWRDWDSINSVWMKTVYFPCLKENNLKMSCANCVYIYIDAIFTIDSYGKLTDIQIVKEKICTGKASEKLKNCFFSFYKKMIFPESLRHRKVKSKFGTGLSC